MRKIILVMFLAMGLVLSGSMAFAAKAKGEAKGAAVKGEAVEKTGTIEVKKAEKGEKFDTVTLKVGADTFKLLPGKDKKIMKDLEKLAGKEVSVKGELLAANDKHPMAAIKVDSFEAKGAADAKPADAKPADAKPADKPAAGSEAGSAAGSEAGSAAGSEAGSAAGSEAGSGSK